MEDRVIRLEERMEFHEREIKEIKDGYKMLSQKLDSMVRSLTAIRNWVIGAIAFAVAEQVGVLNALEKIFKF